jgi:hypothetical protein
MRARLLSTVLAGAVVVAAPAHADVRVSIADGKVTVAATNATLRQILDEWARVGHARIVNADRLGGPPVSLRIENVPEAQALDTLLRSASGYVAAPRAIPEPNASRYDRIYLLASSTGTPPPATAAGPRPFAPPRPPFVPPDDQEPDEPQPGVNGQPAAPVPPRQPAFNTFPQPPALPSRDGAPVAPAGGFPPPTSFGAPAVPNAPVGVSTPGMVVPAPEQPGQQQPGQPPVRQP